MVAERILRSVTSPRHPGARTMAGERVDRSGVPTFEHIDTDMDVMAEEQTVIHGETESEFESTSPINHSSSKTTTPGNTRSRGYSGMIASQKQDLTTPRGEDRPQAGNKVKEFPLTPGSAVTEGPARVYTAGSGSDSGSQGNHSSTKTPIRQHVNSPTKFETSVKNFLRMVEPEDPETSDPPCGSGELREDRPGQKVKIEKS